MALKDQIKRVLNRLNLETRDLKVGDYLVDQATRQGETVDDAAGATPTKAEFDALLASLRDAGLIKT